MSDQIGGFGVRAMKPRKGKKPLTINLPPKPEATPTNDDLDGKQQLEIGIEYNLNLNKEDLEMIKELGSGNGGTVSKVKHRATGTVMARKMIHVEAKPETKIRIVRELQIMHACNCENIVNFYGAFSNENGDVVMCMEYMDVGSFDKIKKDFGPLRVDVLGKVAEATLNGLTYLYIKHHIMHRDIKPSNIVVNSRGNIKLCDFGVSSELVNSVADTFVGTSTYMAPERIMGDKYTVKSDVWSFGLTIMELAVGKFPFDASEHVSDGDTQPASILDLLQQIVNEPAPRLPKSEAFPQILEDMIQKCMAKNPKNRPTPQELYEREPFVQASKRTPVDLKGWAISLLTSHNRKSHLAPQLSPSTQQLLQAGETPTTSTQQTPTTAGMSITSSSASSSEGRPQMVNRDREREREIIVGMGGMSINSNAGSMRPPAQPKASGSIGRAGGSNYHPGLGRISTTNSIPQQKDMVKTPISMERSQSNTQYPRIVERTVELRQAPPAGPLPPPPVPRKESGGRQATYPPHSERQSQNANANYYPSRALYEEADRQARGGY